MRLAAGGLRLHRTQVESLPQALDRKPRSEQVLCTRIFAEELEKVTTSANTIKPLFTIAGASTGGRNGHSETTDQLVKVDFSTPKNMGGPGKPGTVTPEHLFAAGYSA